MVWRGYSGVAVKYAMRNEWAGGELDPGAPHWCMSLDLEVVGALF